MKRSYTLLAVLSVLIVCALASVSSGAAPAKNPDYPTKPITYIVMSGAGGGTDLVNRALCAEAEKILGVPIVVANKVGGSGSVSAAEIAKAPKDGYTIGMTARSLLAIIPFQMELPYTYQDFDHVCTFTAPGFGFVVTADSPFKTMDDVLEAARAPGGLGCAASGYPQPVTMQELSAKYKCQLTYIPFSSGPDIVAALLGGHIKVALITQADATPYVASGQFRLLASASSHRWAVKPDLPTLNEQGYDVLACDSYFTVSVTKGIDKYKLDILRKAFKEAYEKPSFQAVVAKLNYAPKYVPGEEVYAIVEADYKYFEEKLKK